MAEEGTPIINLTDEYKNGNVEFKNGKAKVKWFSILVHKIQGPIIWIMVGVLIGFGGGLYYSSYQHDKIMFSAKQLGGIMYDGKVYDFTFRKNISD